MVIRSKQKLNISNPFNIVLVEPEIPPNTGNIARLCAATNTKLHLVHPLGFEISDKTLKRAGLDYWSFLDITEYQSWIGFENNISLTKKGDTNQTSNFWFISTRGEKNIWNVNFNSGDYLIFGSETKGLNENILLKYPDSVLSIPMNGKTRSLNLSTSVGIVLYEALRQITIEKKEFDIVPI